MSGLSGERSDGLKVNQYPPWHSLKMTIQVHSEDTDDCPKICVLLQNQATSREQTASI